MRSLHAVVLVLVTLFATGCAGLKGQQERPVVIERLPVPAPPEGEAAPEGSAIGIDLGNSKWNRLLELALAAYVAYKGTMIVRDKKAKAAKPA